MCKKVLKMAILGLFFANFSASFKATDPGCTSFFADFQGLFRYVNFFLDQTDGSDGTGQNRAEKAISGQTAVKKCQFWPCSGQNFKKLYPLRHSGMSHGHFGLLGRAVRSILWEEFSDE